MPIDSINPKPAGVLENQDTGGGPQLTLMSKYDKWYVIGLLDSSYAILLKSANKIENLKKLTFLAKSSCKKKCLQKQTDISKKL